MKPDERARYQKYGVVRQRKLREMSYNSARSFIDTERLEQYMSFMRLDVSKAAWVRKCVEDMRREGTKFQRPEPSKHVYVDLQFAWAVIFQAMADYVAGSVAAKGVGR